MAQEHRKRKKKSSAQSTSMKVITVLLIFACACVGFRTWQVKQQTASYAVMAEELETEIEAANEEQVSIREKLEYITTDEYIVDLAREKLGLIYDNELIFKKQSH